MSEHHRRIIVGDTQSYETGVVEAFLAGATYFLKLSLTTTKFWRVRDQKLEYALLRNPNGDEWKLEGWHPCEKEMPDQVSLL